MMSAFGRRAMRPIQQLEAAECGVACLAMILDYYGSSIPLDELRDLCGTSRDGNSALSLLQTAQRLGLDGQGLRMEVAHLESARSPLILHWRMNHFVVLEGFRRGRAVVLDPASGRIHVDLDELSRCFSGIALQLQPTRAMRRRRHESPGITRYFAHLKTGKAAVLFLLIAGAVSQLLGVVAPALQQVSIDEVIAPARQSWLIPVLAVQVAVTLAALALAWPYQMMLLRLQTALGATLTNQIGRTLLRLPLTFVEGRSRGDLIQRVSQHAALGGLLTNTVTGSFQLVFALGLAGLMLAYDLRLALLALGIDGLRVLFVRHLRDDARQRSAGELAARGAETSIVLQAASSGEVLEAFGLERELERWYAARLEERLKWTVCSARLTRGAGAWLGVFDGLAQALVFWIGGSRVVEAEMSIGVFAGFLAIRGLLRAPLGNVVGVVESWLEFRGALGRTDEILRQTPDANGQRDVDGLAPLLELKDVGFRYSAGSPWIFRGVSLRIEAGQNVTLVGPSGQGKSTLLRILAGILRPTEGVVLLDGVDIRECAPASLAKKLGAVVGTPVVIDGSLRDNLRLRCPAASDEEIRQAAHTACFEEVVARMRNGYSSQLSAQSTSLSGGELQRLGLSQALVGGPAILLLDEATCFLDQEVEARVIGNTIGAGTTLVSVAHRQAVIDSSEIVYRVESGQVAREQDYRAAPAADLPGCRVEHAMFAGGSHAA
jgi:ABC-type bacteriocin/lantibiotic exporter with double-glycine peptidase domain